MVGMDEHKLLTIMLIISLGITLFVGISFVANMQGNSTLIGISGAVSGTSDLNITQDITIALPDSEIHFGQGKVDPDQDYAILDSQGGVSTTGGSWDNITDTIVVRNDGNVGINLTVTFDKNNGNNGSSFMCYNDEGNCGAGLS